MLWKKLAAKFSSDAALPVSTNAEQVGTMRPVSQQAAASSSKAAPGSPVHQNSEDCFELHLASIMESKAELWLQNQPSAASQLIAVAAQACREMSHIAYEEVRPQDSILSESMMSSQVDGQCSVTCSSLTISLLE